MHVGQPGEQVTASTLISDANATAVVGAFAGALFAYMFMRLESRSAYKASRLRAEMYALAFYQTALNQHLSILHDSSYKANSIVLAYTDGFKDAVYPLCDDRFPLLELDFLVARDIRNSVLLNRLFEHHDLIRKFSDDCRQINSRVADLSELAVSQRLNPNEYRTNAERTAKLIRGFSPHIERTRASAEEALALVRALIRIRKSRYWRNIGRIFPKAAERKLIGLQVAELDSLRREMVEIERKSQNDIERFEGKGQPTHD